MTNKPKAIGTFAETAVVRFLRASGFEHAERRALRGEHDAGDITGCPGLVFEVKGGKAAQTASDNDILAWLRETETERINANADHGLLVMQRKGVGPANAGRWWAVLTIDTIRRLCGDPFYNSDYFGQPVRMLLGQAVELLRAGGYGDSPNGGTS